MLTRGKIEEFKKDIAKLSSDIKECKKPEVETCYRLITPILNDLGWHRRYGNMVLNEKNRNRSIPDYKLLNNEKKTIVLVEAKKLDIRQLPKYIKQLRDYEEDEENIELLVLTDGNVWKFYLPRRLKGYKDFHYDLELKELKADNLREDLNNLLGRNNVLDGKSSKYLKTLFHLDRIKKEYEAILSETHEQPDKIASLVRREMKKIGFDSKSKEIVQAIFDRMKSKTHEQSDKIASLVRREMKKIGSDSKSKEIVQAIFDRMKLKVSVSDKDKPKGKSKLRVEYGGNIFMENTANAVLEGVLPLFADSYGIKEVAEASKVSREGEYKHPLVMTKRKAGRLKRNTTYYTNPIPRYKEYHYFAGSLENEDRKNRLEDLAEELGIPGFKVDLVY